MDGRMGRLLVAPTNTTVFKPPAPGPAIITSVEISALIGQAEVDLTTATVSTSGRT